MMTGWLVYSVIVSALLAIVATLLHFLRRESGHAVRWIWALGMLGALGLTAAAPSRSTPTLRRVVAGVPIAAMPAAIERTPTILERSRAVLDRTADAMSAPIHAVLRATNRLPRVAHFAAYLATLVSAMVGVLALGTLYRRVLRMRGTWGRATLLGVPVRIAPAAGPAVIGIAPAEIVVPQWLMKRDAIEQQMVLDHELAHVRAHDPLLLFAACVGVALMPWNPAMWYMLSRLRLAVELDCDRRVLRAGAPTRSYAQLLIELSAHRSLVTAAVPSFSHSVSHLERRLLAMTARRSRSSLPARLGGALLASVVLLAACESKLPTSAELDGMTAASATRRVAEVAKIDTSKTVYLLNERVVTKQEAEALAASAIGSIEVVRATNLKKATEIRIKTVQGKPIVVDRSAGDSGAILFRTTGDSSELKIVPGGPLPEAGALASGARIRVRAADGAPSVVVSDKSRKPFDGLLVIDGVITASTDLNSIAPDRIESIEVIKGAAAAALYKNEPAAANGVIKVTLKKK